MKYLKLFVLSLLIGFTVGCSAPQNKEESSTETVKATALTPAKKAGLSVGDEATTFNLKNVDDQMFGLNDLKDNKGAVVIFTCNHCPYAVAYEDRILAIDQKYKALGYPVIAINPNDPEQQPDDSFEKMKVRAEEKGFTFPYLFDEGQKIYPAYGATKTPHVFLLEKENEKYFVRYIGAIDDNYKSAENVKVTYLENALDALLENKEVAETTTKAVGCSIKTSKG
ncbi:thioredoxin family protein [Flammeovirga sp. EKP202]|uniref:thioredoxin family protein n=1 Tax=Flammeovirga sp. EKP202 TaxID=2770592 RepID=UPI00165F6EAF|nr:thioredoxin family protein [Flammeovirga sp. EKP202]MBD0400690.1 thioredoxin family protein [Flammeovirga sp. EKP202]